MTENIEKVKVLIVGGFPVGKASKIYGGQVAACLSLLNSSFIRSFDVSTLDTTQISNPPPFFLIRLILAGKRLVWFFLIMLFQKPDVLIIFLADGASAIEKGSMAQFAQLCGVPVMVFPRAGGLLKHYFSNRWFAAFIKNTLGKADTFLCQGLTFQHFAIQELGFSLASAPIIPNWTASEEYLRIGARREYSSNVARQHILFLGWLEDSKGVFELLEAALILRDAGIPFHITYGGNGSVLLRAQQFVELHKLSDYITFSGWVFGDRKLALLEAGQIFVLPSWSEGLPNAMIEAMSAGLACVVTNVGVIADYVVNGRDALIVEVKNSEFLAATLKKLILDKNLRNEIAQSGYKLAKSTFEVEIAANLLGNAVNNLVKNK
jgi:glycosyltransferase involved in cell wall biosynthesis